MVDFVKKPYVYGGSALLAVGAWALISSGGAIAHGHPSYWVLYGGAIVVGGTAVALALIWRSDETRSWPAGAGTVGLVAIAGLAWWLVPFEATEVALLALQSDDAVVVDASSSEITMTPAGGKPSLGIIFQPGARVDARAYARILRPIAEAGHQVVIVKQPLGVAILSSGFAPDWAADHTDIGKWVVAGHSLGGVVAADNAAADNAISDLILWASYPAADVSSKEFAALSVFGAADGLTSSSDIESSRSDLPDGTVFESIDGAIHSYFGDYGLQPGDGEPGISRDEAQDLIVRATLAFLGG